MTKPKESLLWDLQVEEIEVPCDVDKTRLCEKDAILLYL